MATRTWLGTTSVDGSVAGNWSGGATPIAGDTVIFDGQAVNALLTGTDFGGVLFADVHAYDDYPYDLGTSAAPFRCGAAEFLWQGQGECYIQARGASITRAIIDTASTERVYVNGTTGAMNRIEWIRGIGDINNATNIDFLFVGFKANPAFDANVSLYAANDIDNLHISAGQVYLRQPLTAGIVALSGGVLNIYPDSSAGSGAGIVTLHQGGGTLNFMRNGSISFVITTHFFDRGTLIVEGAHAATHVISTQYRSPGTEIVNEHLLTISTLREIGIP